MDFRESGNDGEGCRNDGEEAGNNGLVLWSPYPKLGLTGTFTSPYGKGWSARMAGHSRTLSTTLPQRPTRPWVLTPHPLIRNRSSTNAGKVEEFRELLQEALPQGVVDVRGQPAGVTVEETGADFLANACLKATAVARFTGTWALADDSGICVDALDGRPGIHSARYAPNNAQRLQRLLEELAHCRDRSAWFISALALTRPDGAIALTSRGVSHGTILEAPIGEGGFGYGPLFWVPAVGLSFAQMTPAQKRHHGHRGRAFTTLQWQLAALLQQQADSSKPLSPDSPLPDE